MLQYIRPVISHDVSSGISYQFVSSLSIFPAFYPGINHAVPPKDFSSSLSREFYKESSTVHLENATAIIY